jgi:hypothetical protein
MVRTIEHESLKIEILRGNVITATTGAVGLAQRFCEAKLSGSSTDRSAGAIAHPINGWKANDMAASGGRLKSSPSRLHPAIGSGTIGIYFR